MLARAGRLRLLRKPPNRNVSTFDKGTWTLGPGSYSVLTAFAIPLSLCYIFRRTGGKKGPGTKQKANLGNLLFNRLLAFQSLGPVPLELPALRFSYAALWLAPAVRFSLDTRSDRFSTLSLFSSDSSLDSRLGDLNRHDHLRHCFPVPLMTD